MAAFLRSPGQVDFIVNVDVDLPSCSNNNSLACTPFPGDDNISAKAMMLDDGATSMSWEVRLKRPWDDPFFLMPPFDDPRQPAGDPGGVPVKCANVWGWVDDNSRIIEHRQYGEIDCPDPGFTQTRHRLCILLWPRIYNYTPWNGEENIYWPCEQASPLSANSIECAGWSIDLVAVDLDIPGGGAHLFWGEVPTVRGLANGTASEPSQITFDTRQLDGSPGYSSVGLKTILRNRARMGYDSITVSVEPAAPECSAA